MRTPKPFGRVILAAMLAISVPASASAQAVRPPAAVPAAAAAGAGAGAAGITGSMIAYVAGVLAGLGLVYVAVKKDKPRPVSRG